MQRLQPLPSPKREILPPGPPSKLETYKIMRNVRGRGPGPARLRALEAQGF